MIIKIRKQTKNYVHILILSILVVYYAISKSILPSNTTYIFDFINVYTFFKCSPRILKTLKTIKARGILLILLFMFLFSIVGFIINNKSIINYLWGIRNVGRFYMFFISCIVLLGLDDVYKLIKIFDYFLYMNVLICSFQFWFLGFESDLVGGFFGTITGCNVYMLVLLNIIACYYMMQYFERRTSLKKLLLMCSCCLYIAILAELKVFFFEIILIFIGCFLLGKWSYRKLLTVIIVPLLTIVVINVITKISPGTVKYLSIDNAVETLTSSSGYTGDDDLNRLTAITTIRDKFFINDLNRKLFGFGLGNCDTSRFSILNTPFYQKNSDLHYTWFMHSMTYIETGIVGIVFLYIFLISLGIYYIINKREKNICNFYLFGIVFLGTVLISTIYNPTLRSEAGYLVAFALAIPFIAAKKEEELTVYDRKEN